MKGKVIKLIKHEIIKIISSKKYIVAMVILLILYTGMAFLMYSNSKSNTPEQRIKWNNEYIEYKKQQIQDKNTSEESKKLFENDIKDIENQNQNLEFQISNSKLEWKERLKKNIENDETQLKVAQASKNSAEIARYTDELANYHYYLDNNIEPTPNDKITAFNILPRVNMAVGILVISLIIAIITSDSVSGEFNPGTIKLLLTKPISREKVLFSKFIASIIVCAASFIAVKLLMFIAMGLIFSFGDYREPISYYSKYIVDPDAVARTGMGVTAELNSLKVYSILRFTLLSEALNLFYVTACASLCFLISNLVKKAAASISMSIVLLVIVSIFTTAQLDGDSAGGSILLHKIMAFSFSTYSSSELLLSGNTTSKLGLSFVTLGFGIGVMVAWTVICYAIANLIFTRRDILA